MNTTPTRNRPAARYRVPEHRNPLQPGQRVSDRYIVKEKIGTGGMGVVYRASEEEIDREVALKVITVDPTLSPAEREAWYARFKSEAQALGSLPPHPNRVVLYQYAHDKIVDVHYMAMEFVHGQQLTTVLQTKKFRAP